MKKKKPKKKEIKFMTTTEIAIQSDNASALAKDVSAYQDFTPAADDLLFPRVSWMVGTSDLVQKGEAVVGEFRDNINGELYGKIDEPFEFIPLMMTKLYWVSVLDPTPKFKRIEPFELGLPRQSSEDGKPIQRMVIYQFFCIKPDQAAVGMTVPFVLSFKSTAEKVGKKLLNQMFVANKMKGLSPAAVVHTLGGRWIENDKGKYIVPEVKPVRMSSDTELEAAAGWAKTLNGGGGKIKETNNQGGDDEEEIPF